MSNFLKHNDKLLTYNDKYLKYEEEETASVEDYHIGFHSGWTTIVNSIIQDPCDNSKMLVAGSFSSWDGWNEPSTGASDFVRILNNGQRDYSLPLSLGIPSNQSLERLVYDSSGFIYLLGSLTVIGGLNSQRIARLNVNDLSLDTTFTNAIGTNGFDNTTLNCAIDNDGKIYVCGYFTKFAGVTTNRIIRLNSDGTRDASFNSGTGFNNFTTSLVVDAFNRVYVGGSFTSYNGSPAYRLIRLNSDGTIDTTFDTSIGGGFNNAIRKIYYDDSIDRIYVCGDFVSYRGSSGAATRIARLDHDGNLDESFNQTTPNSTVFDITKDSSSRLIICGSFHQGGGVYSKGVYRLSSYDGAIDTTFDTSLGVLGTVYRCLTDSSNRVYLAGTFNSYPTNGYLRYLYPGLVRIKENGTNDTIPDRNW